MERESHPQQAYIEESAESRLRREMAESLVRQLEFASIRSNVPPTQSEILQKLHALGPEGVEALLFVLRDPKWARKRRWRYFLVLVTYSLFCIVTLIQFRSSLFYLPLGFALTGLLILAVSNPTPLEEKAAKALAQFDDLRCVGPLAAALALPEGSVRLAARDALVRLLPRLQASDAGLLAAPQKECLYRALGSKDISLILAILEALKHIGGYGAIPYVMPLVMGERQTKDPRVRQAALDCLQVLHLYREQEQAAQTLLRASDRPGTDSEALLRPVSSLSPDDPNELLRPHE